MFIHLSSVLKIDICVGEYFGEKTLNFYAHHSLGVSTPFLKIADVSVVKNFKLSIKTMISMPTKNNTQYAAKKLRKYHV